MVTRNFPTTDKAVIGTVHIDIRRAAILSVCYGARELPIAEIAQLLDIMGLDPREARSPAVK